MPDQRCRLLRATVGFARCSMALVRSRALRTTDLARLLGRNRTCHRWYGATGLRPPANPLRREELARYLIHDRDGALAHERDGHRMGTDALAGSPAGSARGADESDDDLKE